MPDMVSFMRAIRESGLPGLDRHILMNLASLADPATCVIPDRFMPSLTDLADQMGWGRSTIARRIPELEKAGWLKRTTPSLQAAWKDKEKNSYALLVPVSTSPRAGLVPERDGSRSGTSPGAGLEERDTSSESGTSPRAGLVPERDGTSPGAGHEVPDLRTKRTSTSYEVEAHPQPTLDGMPEPPPPARKEPTPEQRAFGLARWWTKERAAANTPVVARGRTGPLHILKNLIQPFAEVGYTDDEIRAALNTLDQGVPSKSQLDTRLANQRRNSPYGQERSNGDLARRGTPPPAPRQSAGTRKAAVGLALGDELDRRYGTGGTR